MTSLKNVFFVFNVRMIYLKEKSKSIDIKFQSSKSAVLEPKSDLRLALLFIIKEAIF